MSHAPVEAMGLINPDAEIAVLAAMRHDTEAAIDLAQTLDASDFYDTRRAVLFEAMRNLLLGPDVIDTAGIVVEARRVLEIRQLKAVISEADVDALVGEVRRVAVYANNLKRLAWLRRAGDFAFWLAQELQNRPDPIDLFAEAQEQWQQLAPQQTNSQFVYGWDTVKAHTDAVRRRVQDYEEGRRVAFDWPWASWNKLIRPLSAGMAGIVAAADGVGKTTVLEQVAEHWATRGWHVVYVHLEDDLEYKLNRRSARHCQLPIDAIEDGSLSREQLAKLHAGQATVAEWAGCLHYYHAPGQSMREIIRELESRVREGVCQAVVFDYLDKVQPSRAQVKLYGDNAWERQAKDMDDLKTFAERNRLPVFTATQGNKSMQNEGTQTRRAIQGSGQKSQKAQLVIILTRELVGENGKYDERGVQIAAPGEYSPTVTVRVDKQNRGKTGSFKQFLVGQYFTVRDIARDTEKK
jgi:replicative DNA helicase